MRLVVFASVLLLFGLYQFSSCTKDQVNVGNLPADCQDTVLFSEQIAPMIEVNCSTSGCHDASAAGGYIFLDYNDVSANATVILNVIKHESGYIPMPSGAPQLPDSIIQQFGCWVIQGKQNN